LLLLLLHVLLLLLLLFLAVAPPQVGSGGRMVVPVAPADIVARAVLGHAAGLRMVRDFSHG